MTPDFDSIWADYSAAIGRGSYADAAGVVEAALDAGATGAEIFTRVLTPAMYRIGERWERAEITVADEHLATAISNRVMGLVYGAHAVEMPTSKERVLITAVRRRPARHGAADDHRRPRGRGLRDDLPRRRHAAGWAARVDRALAAERRRTRRDRAVERIRARRGRARDPRGLACDADGARRSAGRACGRGRGRWAHLPRGRRRVGRRRRRLGGRRRRAQAGRRLTTNRLAA
ncbi:MAG: hypothetical protein AVDCRST_MAG67-2614 [uncultured Solirubrobacteraceae bacterium]|uniref:B12-binding N-terminal domain-containing protein n=1 Tax=uncultured Solirubrobacteraceae bacterium TaxID=1162706 RepID=A0A6J4SZJ6_9ACTN|nr:MAG: hypothetical protein AVDCRST_MAG67-2614 [uncultured Solirubrobacteraceae bacterium]